MKMKIIFGIAFGVFIVLVGSFVVLATSEEVNFVNTSPLVINFLGDNYALEEAATTNKYTSSTETHCIDGVCNKILYSGTRFVNESGWKKIEDANSLKYHFDVVLLEDDGTHRMEVVDFNYSYIEFEFSYDDENLGEFESEIEDGKMKTKYKIRFNDTYTEEYEIEIEEGDSYVIKYHGNPFGKEFHLGENSTAIILQDNETENLGDAHVRGGAFENSNYGGLSYFLIGAEGLSTRGRAYIKFNITSIPDGSTINESFLSLYEYQFGNNGVIEVFNVTNSSWNESTITDANSPSPGSSVSDSLNVTTDDSWYNWNITPNWISSNLDADVVSFQLRETNSDTNLNNFYSKNYNTNISLRPFLNITYTEAPVGIAPYYSQNQTNSTFAEQSILHILNWQDDTALSSYIFSFCNGTWNGTKCLSSAGDAPDDWSDTDYTYRECFNVTETSGSALVDFQVNYSLDTDALISDGKMQADCDDIRIYNNSGNTNLPYWFKDSHCNTTDTQVIFQTDLLESEVQEICIYYGYSSAVDAKNGSNVFEFFDDFSGDLSKWNVQSPYTDSIYISNGALRHDPDSTGDGNDGSRVNTSTFTIANGTLNYDLNLVGGTSRKIHQMGWRVNSLSFSYGYAFRLQNSASDGGFFEFSGGSWSGIGTAYGVISANTLYEMKVNYLGPDMEAFQDGSSIRTVTDSTTATAGGIVSHLHGVSMVNGTDYALIDNVRVSKLISNMPALNSGNEENQSSVSISWVNDTAISFSGTNNWSNVTKSINSTVGIQYAWCVYANDSSNNWNSTSCTNPFIYTSTSSIDDTCTYTSGDWEVDCSDNCVITSNVNLGGNNISILGTGTFTTTANITNFKEILIAGDSSSNICEVTCHSGGCFQ